MSIQKSHTVRVKNVTLMITDPCYIKSNRRGYSYFEESTIYGDWSCFAYKGTPEEVKDLAKQWDNVYFDIFRKFNFSNLSDKEKETLNEEYKQKKLEFVKQHTFGEFCADSGMVAVYDVSKLKEEDIEWAKEHPWCACIIEDFSGELSFVIETNVDDDNQEYESAHIMGVSSDNDHNKSFYTSQSGL